MRIFPIALAALALAACAESPTDAGTEATQFIPSASCAQPAPLTGSRDPRAGGVAIVAYHDGTDSPAVTARLAQKYGFTPRFVYQHALTGFAAPLTDEQIAGIRCEAETRFVQFDQAGIVIGG